MGLPTSPRGQFRVIKMPRFAFFPDPDWLILDLRLPRATLSRTQHLCNLIKLAISTAAYERDDLSPWFGLRVEPMVGPCLFLKQVWLCLGDLIVGHRSAVETFSRQ